MVSWLFCVILSYIQILSLVDTQMKFIRQSNDYGLIAYPYPSNDLRKVQAIVMLRFGSVRSSSKGTLLEPMVTTEMTALLVS
jgi:hypothetical protein